MKRPGGTESRWEEIRFPGELARPGIRNLRKNHHGLFWLNETGRIKTGRMMLRVGPTCLTLDRDDVILMKVPLNTISAVQARPYSVAAQLWAALYKRTPLSTWAAIIKTGMLLIAILFYVRAPQMTPQELGCYVLSSMGVSLWIHLPTIFIPNAWRIEGRRWRLRLIAMNNCFFTIIMDSVAQQEFFDLLRASHLVVYVDPRAETWLDRKWPSFRNTSVERIKFIWQDMF